MFSLLFTYLVLSDDELKNLTMVVIKILLQRNNKCFKYFSIMPRVNMSLISKTYNLLIYDELNYDLQSLCLEHETLTFTKTKEQSICDTIISSVNENHDDLFFLYGYGGTGKTFV